MEEKSIINEILIQMNKQLKNSINSLDHISKLDLFLLIKTLQELQSFILGQFDTALH